MWRIFKGSTTLVPRWPWPADRVLFPSWVLARLSAPTVESGAKPASNALVGTLLSANSSKPGHMTYRLALPCQWRWLPQIIPNRRTNKLWVESLVMSYWPRAAVPDQLFGTSSINCQYGQRPSFCSVLFSFFGHSNCESLQIVSRQKAKVILPHEPSMNKQKIKREVFWGYRLRVSTKAPFWISPQL